MNRNETILSEKETLRERRRDDMKYWAKYWVLFIVLGVVCTVPFWGWIVFGWLIELFH